MKSNLRPEDNIGNKKCDVCGAMCYDSEMPHMFGGDPDAIRIHFPHLVELWNSDKGTQCKWINNASDPPIACINIAKYNVTLNDVTLPLCGVHMKEMIPFKPKVEEIK